MRIKTTFFVLVSAAAVLLSLTGAFAGPASRAEMQEILSAPLSQTDRDLKLLDWFDRQYEQGATLSEADKELYLQLESRYGDARGRDGLDNQGGPDAFQYMFMDNVPPDNVPYEWIELRGDGEATWWRGYTHFTSYDDGYSRQKAPIGFSFPFYNVNYDCVRVATNGFLQFTTTATALTNACMPSTSVDGPMIAMLWDDLHLLYGGRTDTVVVGYRSFGDYFVVEYDQIGYYTTACQNVPLKFEAVLYPNGNIKLQYNSIPVPTACANSQSIGIQQAGAVGSAALNYVCDATGIQPGNGRAILFARAAGVPNPVTNLNGNYVAPNVVLTWTDPNQDTQGNPVTIDNVQVWATAVDSGTLLGTVARGVQTYTDLNPPMGTRRYLVRAYHNPYYGAAVSRSVMVGTPAYWNDFETNNGAWVADPPTGGWEWGVPTYASGPTSAYSGTKVWGTVLASTYAASACYKLTLTPNMTVTSSNASIEFWRWWETEQSYDGVNFKVSTDQGATWTLVQPTGNYPYTASTANVCIPSEPYWAGTTNGLTWAQITIPLGQFLGQMPMFRITFGSDPSLQYAGFYFDDMVIWGMGTVSGVPRPPTNFSGSYAAGNITLTWTDPTLDINNQPMTVDSIQVWLGQVSSGTRLASVGPGVQTYVHLNAPHGMQTYNIRAYNDGFPSTPVSASVMGAPPVYPNDFESDNGGWVADPLTGGWEWGVPTYASGPTAHSGTKVWGTVLASTYAASACYKLTLVQNQPVTSPDASITFWRWYDTEQSFDGVNFKVSLDAGATWTLVQPVGNYPYTASTANVCIPSEPYWAGTSQTWTEITIPLGQFLGQTPWLRFSFGSDASLNYAGFYIDDMNITGIGQAGAVPRPPTNLSGNYAGSNVTLTWTDPTQDINNQPMTVDSIQVWLGAVSSGTRLGSVAPGIQSYVHLNAPTGIQTYSIRAYNDGFPSTGVSTTVTVGNPSYVNNFDVDNGGWAPDPPTGGWEWGAPTAATGPQPHSAPNCWGTVLAGNYVDGACWKLDLNLGGMVQSPTATVEFWRWYSTENTFDGVNFKVSVDDGQTWTVVVPDGGYPLAALSSTWNRCGTGGQSAWAGTGTTWQQVVIPIGQFVGQTPIFRFDFTSDSLSTEGPGFFIDDMIIWGMRAPSSVAGTVRAFVTNVPIRGAQVWAAGESDTAVTDAGGAYELPLDAGTYTLWYRHIHFCDTVHTNVVVETGSQTVHNAVMRAPHGQVSVTSFALETPQGVNVVDSFQITNTGGQCPLSFTISDTSAWLSVDAVSGTVLPNQTATIHVQATVTGLAQGDYVSALLIIYNSTGSPADIRVDLHVGPSAVDENLPLPTEFAYYQNYPNPFNATTVLRFDVPQQSRVQIAIFNIMGQEVARPVDEVYVPGRYRLLFDAGRLPSGMYLVKMSAADYTKIGKMMLLK